MISTQLLKKCIDDLAGITKIMFTVYDTAGAPVAMTADSPVTDAQMIAHFAASPVDSQIIGDCYLLKVLEDGEPAFVVAATGSGDNTLMIARIAVSEIETLMATSHERNDRSSYFQNLLLDNLLLVDITGQAKKLHVEFNKRRGIILFDADTNPYDTTASELMQEMFREQNGDYLTAIDTGSVILIKALEENESYERLEEVAEMAVDTLETEAMLRVRASYGTIAENLKDLSASYKEARMAMDCGKIFYAEKKVISYNRLGIGRLIYQLPPSLCETFITEVFEGHRVPDDLDSEELNTIQTFFENNLNVSETARQLFIHRNTLVYRIEKLQKECGLDIRDFREAMTLRIALMILQYMRR